MINPITPIRRGGGCARKGRERGGRKAVKKKPHVTAVHSWRDSAIKAWAHPFVPCHQKRSGENRDRGRERRRRKTKCQWASARTRWPRVPRGELPGIALKLGGKSKLHGEGGLGGRFRNCGEFRGGGEQKFLAGSINRRGRKAFGGSMRCCRKG